MCVCVCVCVYVCVCETCHQSVQCVQIMGWFVFQPLTVTAPYLGFDAMIYSLLYFLSSRVSQPFYGFMYVEHDKNMVDKHLIV